MILSIITIIAALGSLGIACAVANSVHQEHRRLKRKAFTGPWKQGVVEVDNYGPCKLDTTRTTFDHDFPVDAITSETRLQKVEMLDPFGKQIRFFIITPLNPEHLRKMYQQLKEAYEAQTATELFFKATKEAEALRDRGEGLGAGDMSTPKAAAQVHKNEDAAGTDYIKVGLAHHDEVVWWTFRCPVSDTPVPPLVNAMRDKYPKHYHDLVMRLIAAANEHEKGMGKDPLRGRASSEGDPRPSGDRIVSDEYGVIRREWAAPQGNPRPSKVFSDEEGYLGEIPSGIPEPTEETKLLAEEAAFRERVSKAALAVEEAQANVERAMDAFDTTAADKQYEELVNQPPPRRYTDPARQAMGL